MHSPDLVTTFFLIFTGAAVLATLALFTRQPLLVAYIVLGALLGPYGVAWVTDPTLLREIAEIGIIFLLFLLGLDMQPRNLARSLREALLVGFLSSVAFLVTGFGLGVLFGYTTIESLIIGAAMMFSSTIIGIKLLPTTVLHHRHTGELVVSLLLFQDLIAIVLLIVIGWKDVDAEQQGLQLLQVLVSLPLLVGFAFVFVRFVLLKLMAKFDVFHEFIFLVAIGWCLGFAELAQFVGLSLEIGAFIGGVALATSPISQYIAESLRPLRDFFLILFFFSIGAGFDTGVLPAIAAPALILALAMLVLKPVIFRFLLASQQESQAQSWEVGFRLGQISEFSLLTAYLAASGAIISLEASYLIQATAILTFLVSSYLVVFRYPTPIALSDRLRRD
ncbi:MAG: cation:proton antiporter [Pseudomonadales bacterium]